MIYLLKIAAKLGKEREMCDKNETPHENNWKNYLFFYFNYSLKKEMQKSYKTWLLITMVWMLDRRILSAY